MKENCYNRKTEICICHNCGIEFKKPSSEIKRNEKLSRPNFCSRICVGKNNSKNLLNVKNRYNISNHSNNRKTKDTKFNYHFRNIKNRNKECDVTIEDLKKQWENQLGCCYFSGVKLELMSYSKTKPSQIYSASLDRIDSNQGYIKNNIRWVSKSINYMKNIMTDEQVWELCEIIKESMNKKSQQT